MTKKTTKRLYHQDGRKYLLEGEGGASVPQMEITTLTYDEQGYVIQVIYTYVGETETFEERFEYTTGKVTKSEKKDTLKGYWVQVVYTWNGDQMEVPTYSDITDWTIIIVTP